MKTLKKGLNCYISENSSIRGDVILGDDCSVFDFASIRADLGRITIGNCSNVQDNCTFHCDPGHDVTLGKYVSVGHNAVIHGCTVEDYCIIGMGAIVMNGAHISRGSIVAAGAVVLQNAIFEPNSLIAGLPATVKKISASNMEAAKRNAMEYIELKDMYLKEKISE